MYKRHREELCGRTDVSERENITPANIYFFFFHRRVMFVCFCFVFVFFLILVTSTNKFTVKCFPFYLFILRFSEEIGRFLNALFVFLFKSGNLCKKKILHSRQVSQRGSCSLFLSHTHTWYYVYVYC